MRLSTTLLAAVAAFACGAGATELFAVFDVHVTDMTTLTPQGQYDIAPLDFHMPVRFTIDIAPASRQTGYAGGVMFPVTTVLSPASSLMLFPPNSPVFQNAPFFGTSTLGRRDLGNGVEESVGFGYGRYLPLTGAGYYAWNIGVGNMGLTIGDPELTLTATASDLTAFLTHVQNDPSLYPQFAFPLFEYNENSELVNAAGEVMATNSINGTATLANFGVVPEPPLPMLTGVGAVTIALSRYLRSRAG